MKIFYVGLEKLASRYTYQLTEWNTRVFEYVKLVDSNFNYEVVNSETIDDSTDISLGQVLDAYGRPFYALGQIQNLIKRLKHNELNSDSVIFFEDMFHPGIESLFYVLSFVEKTKRPKIVVRCLAQTIDPNDFVHITRMNKWMRKYEEMVNEFVDLVCVASTEMAVNFQVAGWTVPVAVTGLPFGRDEVQNHVVNSVKLEFAERPLKVVFAARTDREKMPEFFLQLANSVRHFLGKDDIDFSILSGKSLNSNDDNVLNSLREARDSGLINIHENLSKVDYYRHLMTSRVLFNCALQDWVSNTVSEADALGCNVVYPAYRSFPETFQHDETRLYVPWSLKDATIKVARALCRPHPYIGHISNRQNYSINRTLNAIRSLDGIVTSLGLLNTTPIFRPEGQSNYHVESVESINDEIAERHLSKLDSFSDSDFWTYSKPTLNDIQGL